MSWASKNHIYNKESSDVTEAETEFEGLRSQYAGTDVEGSIYSTSSAKGKEGRLTYLGSDEELPLDGWNHKSK